MGSAKIKLPGFIMADLFRSSLVVLNELKSPGKIVQEPEKAVPIKQEPADQAPEKQWYLGNNGKNITILVNDPTAVFLNDASLQFLSAILGACRLNLGDVALVNLQRNPVSYTIIKEKLAPRQVLAFNIAPQQADLPFIIPHYQVQPYDQCQFLLAPSLETMQGNGPEAKLEKSKLWLCLKKMFSV